MSPEAAASSPSYPEPVGESFERKVGLALSLAILTLCMNAPAFAASTSVPTVQQDPVTAINAFYTATDAAMTSNNAITHPAMVAQSAVFPSSTQLHLSSSPQATFLYGYVFSRVQVIQAWAMEHQHDFSALHVWSSFQPASVQIIGSQAIVTGAEQFHVDSTVKSNGSHPQMSQHKQAAIALAKRNGNYIDNGQTNHGLAVITHTVHLSKTSSGWAVESDTYHDILEPGLSIDHMTLIKERQPTGTSQATPVIPALRSGFTYYRQAAINYANTWATKGRCSTQYSSDCCNSSYNCYEVGSQAGNDCANFVSQSIYDGAGDNLPGDNTWYSIPGVGTSNTFVNASMLQSYLAQNFASVNRNDEHYAQAKADNIYWEAPGDLMFYSWDGGPIIDHTAISVSADSNGITQVNAHTDNVYHWYWDLEGRGASGYDTGATYWLLMIADNN